MATAARWDIASWRNEARTFTIRVRGLDLTGVALRQQVRDAPDTPGAPLIALQTVTDPAAEGLRLESVTFENGVPVSTVVGRYSAGTMRDKLPYGGEIGQDYRLSHAIQIGGVTRLYGDWWARATPMDSDSADTAADFTFLGRSSAGPSVQDAVSITITDNDVVEIAIDGADLLAPMVAQAEAARDAVKPLLGFGPPDAHLGIVGSTYRQVDNLDFEWVKTGAGWQGPRNLRGSTGGNVMAVGLRTQVNDDTTIGDGVGCIQFSGFRQHGVGAHQMFLWQPPMAVLDPAGQGFWWTTTNGGAKRWFIPSNEGTPEMLGAYADDGAFAANSASRGTDDWIYLKKAVDYFSYVKLTGKYRSSRCINLLRTVSIVGLAGNEAGNYTSRVRFDRGCVGFFAHRYNTNADDTGKVPRIEARATTASADGFYIGFLEIVMGQGDRIAYDGSNLTEHAIWHKARGTIENVRIRGAMGHAIYAYATAVSTNPFTIGNTNGSTVRNVRAEQLTGSVLHWQGADANAGRSAAINGAMTGGPCIGEFGFLGNSHDTPQTANAGRDGFVYYGGFRWWCVDPALASTQQPGTGSAWFKGDATTQADNWVSGKPYYYGGSYVSGSNTARVVWNNPYTEGGSGPLMVLSAVDTQTWVVGGLLSGDGAIMGNCGWLSPQGLRIYGRNGVTGSSLIASGGISGLGAQATLHNTGNIGSGRGSAVQINVAYEADGVTPHPVARYAARSGANLALPGEMQLDLYSPSAAAWSTTMLLQSAAVLPGADSTIALGSAPRRFSQVFAANATINTSDARQKTDILPIDDALLDAWADVEWRQFRMVDAIETKGEEARIHTGVIAQQVRDALLAHGIDGTRYGLLCFDRWDAEWEEWEDEFEDRAAVYAFDNDNRHVFDGDEPVIETPAGRVLVRKAGHKLIREAGELWGVRYTEAFAVEAAYQRRRMDRIEARLAAMQ